jgi:excisionase family DNA binding protein
LIAEKTLSQTRVERDYYTTRQVAELYHVTPQTVSGWIRKGWLQATRLGDGRSRWRVHPQQLEDEIEMHRDELVELSRRYWPMLLMKMRK